MFEDVSQLTAGGVLALLLIREVFSFLKTRNGNGKGKPKTAPIPGNPHPIIDLTTLEAKLDRIGTGIGDLLEAQIKLGRSLDDLQHSGDKTRQLLGDVQETLTMLEKGIRNRE